MPRYTCFRCNSEHGTENMVPICAACHALDMTAWRKGERDLESQLSTIQHDLDLAADTLAQKDAELKEMQSEVERLRAEQGYDRVAAITARAEAAEKERDELRLRRDPEAWTTKENEDLKAALAKEREKNDRQR